MNLRIIKATCADDAAARSKRDLVERVWRLSNPPRELETKATITAKMFLDAEALVRLKMSRSPCASGPLPTHVSSMSEPDFTADSLEPSTIGAYHDETLKFDETLMDETSELQLDNTG